MVRKGETRVETRRNVAARRQKVAKFLLQGVETLEMAHRLGVTAAVVNQDCGELEAEWQIQRMRDVNAVKLLCIERTLAIIREAWDAWDRSKEPGGKTTTTTSQIPIKMPDGTVEFFESVTVREEKFERDGDATFLRTLIKAQQQLCHLYGIRPTFTEEEAARDQLYSIDPNKIDRKLMRKYANLVREFHNQANPDAQLTTATPEEIEAEFEFLSPEDLEIEKADDEAALAANDDNAEGGGLLPPHAEGGGEALHGCVDDQDVADDDRATVQDGDDKIDGRLSAEEDDGSVAEEVDRAPADVDRDAQ